MNYFSKAIGVLRKEGPFELFRRGIPFVYNQHIAPLLPRTTAVYNGVEVKGARYFDSLLAWRDKDKPHYESGIVSGIENHVKPGDSVVIVGGGWGVTAVKATQTVGSSGKVMVYEGSAKETNHIRDTLRANNLSDRVNIIHSVVGPMISLRGDAGATNHTSPEDLPECDVLELDCEGSEIEILENLLIRPRVILVESHGMLNAPSSKVEGLLEDMSYSIKSKEVADKGLEEFCRENDIHSLVAARE